MKSLPTSNFILRVNFPGAWEKTTKVRAVGLLTGYRLVMRKSEGLGRGG